MKRPEPEDLLPDGQGHSVSIYLLRARPSGSGPERLGALRRDLAGARQQSHARGGGGPQAH